MTQDAHPSEFIIAVLDSSGNPVGEGPITTAQRVTTQPAMDAVSEASFVFPASDPRGSLVQAGRRFDVFDRGQWIGRYIYAKETMSGRGADAVRQIRLWDIMLELTQISVKFFRSYNDQPVITIINDLLSLVSGWSAEVDSGLGNETITYEGESVLAAIDTLRKRLGLHYRLKTTTPGSKILQFGAFGDDSGIRVTNAQGQVQGEYEQYPHIAIVDELTLVDDAQEVYNRLIITGAGQGVSQITIEGATLGSYAVQSGLNQDGSSYYYIEDAASVAQFGPIERVLNFDQIRPITNSDANILNAKNALKIAGEAFLTRHTQPQITYTTGDTVLRKPLAPGDKVRLVYTGVVDGYQFVNEDADYWVLKIERRRSTRGERFDLLTICTTDEQKVNDKGVIVNLVQDVSQTKLHIPLTLTYSPIGPYTRRIDDSNDAVFTVRIKEEVLALNRALLRFNTQTLKSSVSATAEGGDHNHLMFAITSPSGFPATTPQPFLARDGDGAATLYCKFETNSSVKDVWTRSSSGDLTINITYGIYADTVYPGSVRIAIDGVDRTTELGGPWGTTGASTGDVELDITDYLVNAAGGLRQAHTIVFSCDDGRGEIEVEIDNLLTIQPIAVS